METKTRRQPTRIYRVSETTSLKIEKEWSMKYGQYIYRVTCWPDERHTLVQTPTFAEARQYVRDYR